MKVIDKGGNAGEYDGIECPAWIRGEDGTRYDFFRNAYTNPDGGVPLDQLEDDEQLLAPGVIYKKARPETSPPCCAGECEICGMA